MSYALGIGTSALQTFQKNMDIISANIGNVGTDAYKTKRGEITESFVIQEKRSTPSPGPAQGSNSTAISMGTGASVSGITTLFEQGQLVYTSSPTHLAVFGEGYFKVADKSAGGGEKAYATRLGDFRFNSDGNLVNGLGYHVQGLTGGAISYNVTLGANDTLVYTQDVVTAPTTLGTLNKNFNLAVGNGLTNQTGDANQDMVDRINAEAPKVESFEINEDGQLMLSLSNNSVCAFGQILLMDFKDEQALNSESNGLYTGFDAAGAQPFDGAHARPGSGFLGIIKSRHKEGSNANLTELFAQMIQVHRSFQGATRIITTEDQLLEEVVNLKRR